MPRIPQRPISKETYISDFRLATPRITSRGVAKARPTAAVAPGETIMAQILGDVAGAAGDIAEYFAGKEEMTRVAKSQHLQMDVNGIFRDLKRTDSERSGEQAAGMLEEFRGREEELRTLCVPDDLDGKTTRELNTYFDKMYDRHAEGIVDWTIRQSDVADKEALLRGIQNAHQNIASLSVGDSMGVEQEVEEALRLELERHPNLTENQIETNRRAFREDFLAFAITKWITDSPIAVVDFWDKNQKQIQKALPKVYNQLNSRINVARDDAKFDTALQVVRRLAKGDDATAAMLIEKNAETYGLDAKQALSLASMLRSAHTYKIAEEERIRTKKEETYLMSSIDKYYDIGTGVTDIAAALIDLEQARRSGIVDSTTYKSTKTNLLSGEKFSIEESHLLLSMIDDQEITTKGEILTFVYGKGVNPAQYFNALEQRTAQVDKGFTTNWLKVAYQQFEDLARITRPKDLPSGIAKKDLLIDITTLPAFKEDLEAEVRRLGYAAGDPRISAVAKELLVGGWYSKSSPEFHPGEAPWLVMGEEYLRKYQYDPKTLFQEGKIMYLPKTERETAIGGTLGADVIEMLRTPEGLEAYQRLVTERIAPTKENMESAKIIIEREKK